MNQDHEAFLGFINSVREAKKQYADVLTRYMELDTASKRITPKWGADGGGGGDSQQLWSMRADEASHVADAKAAVDRAAAELIAFIAQLDGWLSRRILRLRYVKCMSWPRICKVLKSYSDRQIYRIHREALSAAEELWTKNKGGHHNDETRNS